LPRQTRDKQKCIRESTQKDTHTRVLFSFFSRHAERRTTAEIAAAAKSAAINARRGVSIEGSSGNGSVLGAAADVTVGTDDVSQISAQLLGQQQQDTTSPPSLFSSSSAAAATHSTDSSSGGGMALTAAAGMGMGMGMMTPADAAVRDNNAFSSFLRCHFILKMHHHFTTTGSGQTYNRGKQQHSAK
jgi:hypothetical protein